MTKQGRLQSLLRKVLWMEEFRVRDSWEPALCIWIWYSIRILHHLERVWEKAILRNSLSGWLQNLRGPVTQKMEGTWSREGNSMSKYHYIIVHPILEVYNETKGWGASGRISAAQLSNTIHFLWEPFLLSHSQRLGVCVTSAWTVLKIDDIGRHHCSISPFVEH